MIFLSAQPAKFYFKWQLEVQLYNFSRLKIKANDIHVLLGYDPVSGIDKRMLKLVEENKSKANFYFYEDTRPKSNYEPTIRPHIIKKHFNKFPFLEKEVIFYHDSDIIFRKIPDFKKLLKDDVWYLSDTKSYLSSHLISSYGTKVLAEMCDIVGICPIKVAQNSNNTGGAQYLMKNVNAQFWEKHESDSNALYEYLSQNKRRIEKLYLRGSEGTTTEQEFRVLQEWCADMWSILWNGWLFGNEIKVHPELSFAWPKEELSCWEENKILHNAGIELKDSPDYFFKNSHTLIPPYDLNFSNVKKDKCTIKYVEEIQAYLSSVRHDFKDVTFLFLVRIDSPVRLENLELSVAYLIKSFKTNIHILEVDLESKIERNNFSEEVVLDFQYDNRDVLHRAKYHNIMINTATTPIVCLFDADVIINPSQIVECVNKLRKEDYTLSYPYDGTFVDVSSINVKQKFKKELDIGFLECDNSSIILRKSYGGAVCMNKNRYQSAGLENISIKGWGPDDIERVARVLLLGQRVFRAKGELYHFSHPRGINSQYPSDEDAIDRISCLIDICNTKNSDIMNLMKTG